MDLETEIQQQKINLELQQLDDLLVELKKDDQVPTKIPEPTVSWIKRDKDGNRVYKRARSTRNQLPKSKYFFQNMITDRYRLFFLHILVN